MSESKDKRHPAATGRFASYAEIVSNFSFFPAGRIPFKGNKSKVSPLDIFLVAVLLLISVFFTILFNRNNFSGIKIFFEYILVWAFLSFSYIYFIKNIIRGYFTGKTSLKTALPDDFTKRTRGLSDAELKTIRNIEKPFSLGILRNKDKMPDLFICVPREKRFEHIVVISPTGGGKTSRYIVPGIIDDAGYEKTSVFAIDIDSPYLFKSASGEWLKNSKKVVNFDPFYGGIHFNPLMESPGKPLSDDGLFSISTLLFHIGSEEMKNADVHAHKYYSKRSSEIFFGSMLYLKYRYEASFFNLPTVKSFFEKGAKFIESGIKGFTGEKNKKIREIFTNFFELPLSERAKIITDILINLDFLNDGNVSSRFKSADDKAEEFFLEDFFNNDTLFIAGIPKEKISAGGEKLMSFIAGIFIKGVYEHRRNVLFRAEGERDIFIYLDEFPALFLNDFDVELANLRKTGTGVFLTAQDISFIKKRYGDAPLILSNVGTQILIGNPGYETCEYYSRRSGLKYVDNRELLQKTAGRPGIWNKKEASVASGLYPLISPEELKNMERDSAFIYTKFTNPFILNLIPR